MKENTDINTSNKNDHKKFQYDPNQKSWIGPKGRSGKPTQIYQKIHIREQQLKQQDPATVVTNKTKLPRVLTPNLKEIDNEPADSLEGEPLHVGNQSSRIPHPSADKHSAISWKPPTVPVINRSDMNFSRPVTEKTEHYMTTNQQIKRLEQELQNKEDEVTLLRQHLFKAHQENDKLVNQLKMLSGKDYAEVVKENQNMKAQIERMHRQIQSLAGEKMRVVNSRL